MTLQLPPALTPWGAELAMFPLDLAIELGGIIRRLASAIGPPVTARHRGDDPDGFDGILRSGPYDRMLHSEWLLADEMPDEFLRRAIMREQLFFRIARRSPLDDLMSVALFDAGPSQIGAPRLLHLALLIVLARRCAERGGTFRWAVLQQEPRRIYERIDADAVQDLLSMRSAHEVAEDELDEWLDLLPHGDRRHRETWMIGGERLARVIESHTHRSEPGREFREVSLVTIAEPLDVDARELDVRVRDARGAQRRLTLNVPEESAAIRLIRSPFDTAAEPAPVKDKPIGSSGELFFAADGNRVIARAPNGGIFVSTIRKDRQVAVKEYQARRGKEHVIAAGWGNRGGVSIAVVPWVQSTLRIGSIHRNETGQLLSVHDAFPFDRTDVLSPLVGSPANEFDVLFLDALGNCWWTEIGEDRIVRVTDSVAAIARYERRVYLARQHGGCWQIIEIERRTPRVIDRFNGEGRAFFGATPVAGRPLVAVEEGHGRWLAAGRDGMHHYACPPGAEIIGVTATSDTAIPSLVAAESHAISLLAGTSMRPLVQTRRPITVAAFDWSGPRLAYVSGGRLIVRTMETS